ncbi:MAG TPA: Stp1/IreP family PP2C-type Ser/Thr phosphatase [Ktedonobacter sp.]|nr:Stp1/IreP family PP2C-type Ser/Thr phosphatase [Ktedonobacter sp.]
MSNQLRLDVAQLTDVGRKRPHNEDHMAHVIPKDPQTLAKKGALFVVADGMGGHAAGEIASEIAVETISVVYYQDDNEDVSTSLVHAIKRANTLIHQRAAENMLRSGMGTTCVAAVLRGSTAYIANVGDSRLYLVRGNHVQQISQDHSWVAEQVRAKLLTEEQARSHAQRNVITRCLGTQTDVDVDLFIEPLEVEDALILCSDGLSGLLEDDELLNIVNQYVPQESVYHLIERANEHGGPDNITAIVVRVQEVGWEPTPVLKNGANGHGTNGFGEQGVDAIAAMPTLGLPQFSPKAHSSGSLRYSSGPLGEDFQQYTAKPRRNRRLVYSTLIIALLILVAIVGSGIFYLFHLNTVDVNGTLSKAQTLILNANNQISGNNPDPALALQYLATAQKELRSLQGVSSLTDTQKTQLTKLLNDDLQKSVATAVNTYNQQANILSSPCLTLTTTAVNTGSTGTHATSIIAVQGPKVGNTFFYTLGDNSTLYQLSANHSLVNPFTKWSPANTQVVTVVGDGSRLLALTKTPTQTNAASVYSVSVLTPSNTGSLAIANSQQVPATPSTVTTQTPTLLTAWGSDVYVALTSTTSGTATIDHYTINNNKLNAKPDTATISTTTSLVSMAAFPNRQLFFLFNSGIVSSMQFAPGNQSFTSVSVQQPISQPLPIESNTFIANTPVPTPIAQPTVTQKQTFLAIPNASLLVAGSVNGISRLYIVDSNNHRVLSLKSNTVGAASTTTSTSPSTTVTLQLDEQFVDAQLSPISSVVTDPNQKVPQVYLLVGDPKGIATLYALNPNQNIACNG